MKDVKGATILVAVLCLAAATEAAFGSEGEENATRPMEFPLDHGKVILRTDTLLDVYGVSSHCRGCAKEPLLESVAPQTEAVLPAIDCRHPYLLEFFDGLWARSMANVTLRCGDRGVYLIAISHNANGTLAVKVAELLSPIRWWVPIVIAAAALVVAAIGAVFVRCLHTLLERRRRRRAPPQFAPIAADDSDIDPLLRSSRGVASLLPSGSSISAAKQPRVVSLDVFRGLTLCVMVFVNHGAGGYWFLQHATWNGIGLADVVFPWFVWIMGASIALTLKGVHRSGKFAALKKIAIRTAELFAIGLFLNNGYDVAHWRIPGVLQRLAISYFVVSCVGAFVPKVCSRPRNPMASIQDGRDSPLGCWSPLRDIAPFAVEYVFMLALVAAHTAVTFALNVPGCGRGYLGPGGLADNGNYANCTGGAAGYIDRIVLGRNHIYRWGTSVDLYDSVPFDPEGILGCLTSSFQCFLGLQAGRTIVNFSRHRDRLLRLFLWGIVTAAAGIGLCGASWDNGIVPLNKNLWSISFVLVLSGAAFLGLALCYLLIDVAGIWSGHPFKIVGMNSIGIYVLSDIFEGYFPVNFKPPEMTHAWLLASSLIGVTVWVLVAYWMFWKKIFIKLG